jgi:hypothetical protein
VILNMRRQLYYKQPIIIGPLGRTNVTVEMGKPGTIPLGLLSVIPGIKLIIEKYLNFL